MRNYLITLFLLCWMPAQAQVSIDDYLSDFDYGIRAVENIYSGFDIKVTSETRQSYEHVKDSIRATIADGLSGFEDAFGCYLAWFKDYHLHDYCGAQDKYMKGPVDYSAFMEYNPSDMFAKVDDATFLIRYTSCVGSPQRKRWIKKSIRMFHKSHCENLILDLRGNKGGAAGASDDFIKLLYDHDGYYNGIAIRNTPANIDYFRKTTKHDRYWQKHLDASEQSEEEYPTLFEPYLVHYDNISTQPRKAAVIIDNNTASAAEEFILILQRVSNRVTIFGKEHSLGCLDYANAGSVTLPNSGYRFRVPLTRSLGLPATGIDANGIAPDVMIDCAYPQTLTNNIDDFVLWVASYLTNY